MAGISWESIARPYARAAFRYAVEENDLESWSALLNQTTLIINDKAMQALLKDPRFDKMVAYECLLTACKKQMFTSAENFLKLIAVNRRLIVLPVIEKLFKHYIAERANQITVQAISAVPLTKTECVALTTALKKRLQQEVKLDNLIDKNLLGGLKLRINDFFVIDNSVRGKLERLRAVLIN